MNNFLTEENFAKTETKEDILESLKENGEKERGRGNGECRRGRRLGGLAGLLWPRRKAGGNAVSFWNEEVMTFVNSKYNK